MDEIVQTGNANSISANPDFGSATLLKAHDFMNNNGVYEAPMDTHQRIRIDFDRSADAGASIVLQSKGNWWHAGFHLTTAIVGPTILTLPFTFRGTGWTAGLLVLSISGLVTFYSYFLMSLVLDHCEKQGRRHIRFRELACDILGSGWIYYFVVSIQAIINTGIVIGCILLAAECIQIMYLNMQPDGSLKLYHFVMMVSVLLILLSQLPSFHSLRHINLASLISSFGYSICVVIACIYAGHSRDAPPRDYSLVGTTAIARVFDAFTAISIVGSIFGNGILPEIQATLAPPVTGKMFKGLCMCYGVILLTFFSVATSGYWAFGNKAQANILESFLPEEGPALAPKFLLAICVICILLQLLCIGMVYSQVIYEIMEKKSADVKRGVFSLRNLLPRMILRSLYIAFCAVFAAMLPFFGDISAIAGAIGFIPLDFILPMLLYNKSFKVSRRSFTFWINTSIMVIFTGVGIIGTISSVRQFCLDAGRFEIFSGKSFD